MSQDNSGPAFPAVREYVHGGGTGIEHMEGMTIRDYIFAAALQGLCANPNVYSVIKISQMVEEANEIADEAIKQRNQPMNNFKQIKNDIHESDGGERWIRHIDKDCWISALHRLTGFGWMEWETAIVFVHEVNDRPRTWKDRDVLIIAGDRREELNDMPKEKLRDWYSANIEGNRNSMETVIQSLKESAALTQQEKDQ